MDFLDSQTIQDSQDLFGELPAYFTQHTPVQPNMTPQPASLQLQLTVQDQLRKVDPEKKLSIWTMKIEQYEDVIVKEYIRLALKYPLPQRPSAEHIELNKLKSDDIPIKKETQVEVLNLLHTYFQELYFIQNVREATEREITLFNPLTRFLIPSYAMMPLFYFEKVEELKTALVLAMQTEAIRAKLFNTELNLFKVFDLISTDLGDQNKEQLVYVYAVCYEAARKNFKKTFPIKKHDWNKKKGAVHGSLSHWRKEGKPPPPTAPNRYAAKLTTALEEGKVKLSAVKVHSDFESIFETAQTSQVKAPKQQFTNKRRQPGPRNGNFHRVAVKDLHLNKDKSDKPPPRSKNAHLDRLRGLARMDVSAEEES